MIKNHRKIVYIVILLILLFGGFAIGRVTGKYFIAGVIKGNRSALLLYKPPFEYIYITSLLSSSSDLKRLEGYYALLDNKIIDTDLLIDRYQNETVFIKPAIIWLLGYSDSKDKVLEFLSAEYINSDQRIKTEILKTMKRLDEKYFAEFSKKLNIKDMSG